MRVVKTYVMMTNVDTNEGRKTDLNLMGMCKQKMFCCYKIFFTNALIIKLHISIIDFIADNCTQSDKIIYL